MPRRLAGHGGLANFERLARRARFATLALRFRTAPLAGRNFGQGRSRRKSVQSRQNDLGKLYLLSKPYLLTKMSENSSFGRRSRRKSVQLRQSDLRKLYLLSKPYTLTKISGNSSATNLPGELLITLIESLSFCKDVRDPTATSGIMFEHCAGRTLRSSDLVLSRRGARGQSSFRSF